MLFRIPCGGPQAARVNKGEEVAQSLIGITVRLIAETDGKILKSFDYIIEVTRGTEFKVEPLLASIWTQNRLREFQVEGLQFLLKLHQIWMEAHNKGEAIGNYFDEGISAWKRQQEKITAGQAKEWEAKAATFIGLHLSEHQKTRFLNSHPSIEDGLNGKYRLTFRPPNAPKPTTPDPTHWTLNDSIEARVDRLKEFGESVR